MIVDSDGSTSKPLPRFRAKRDARTDVFQQAWECIAHGALDATKPWPEGKPMRWIEWRCIEIVSHDAPDREE